jgi:hypothetical protein
MCRRSAMFGDNDDFCKWCGSCIWPLVSPIETRQQPEWHANKNGQDHE